MGLATEVHCHRCIHRDFPGPAIALMTVSRID